MDETTRIAGRYQLERRLGRGGMGEVWLARDGHLRRQVAVKWLLSDQGHERLIREGRAIAALSHPGIVQVHDVGVHEGRPYLVMERVHGRPLRERAGPLSPDEVVRILVELADALQVAHDAGVVHRDIKPDNVMVQDDGRLVLLDFGLATEDVVTSQDEAENATVRRLTASGAIVGTPAYMAPEQARGRGVGPATDQFALCVMAVELLTGRLPWEADNAADLLVEVLSAEPRLEGIDEPLRSALSRGLRKAPEQRFASITELAQAVAGPARPAPREPSSSLKRGKVLVALGALVALAGLASWASSREPPAAPAPAGVNALRFGESHVACPQLEVSGPDGDWLGAAVAADVCFHLWIPLGGPPALVHPPADLLGLPTTPSDEGPDDPFAAPGARARQVAAAHAYDAWLDGRIERAPEGLRVELTVRDREDRPLGQVELEAAPTGVGVALVEALRERGAIPSRDALEDGAAAVLGTRSVTSALTYLPLSFMSGVWGTRQEERCARVRGLDDLSGELVARLPEACRPPTSVDAVVPATAGAFDDLGRAVALHEQAMAQAAAADWSLAHASGLRSMQAWPSGPGSSALMSAARHRESARTVYRAITYWQPHWAHAWTHLGTELEPGSAAQLEMTQRGYALLANPGTSADVAALLIQRGEWEQVRTVAARLMDSDGSSILAELLIAAADAGEGRFRAARDRFRGLLDRDDWLFGTWQHQDALFVDLVGQLRVLTGSTELVDEFVRRFLLVDPPRLQRVHGTSWRLRASAVMCGLASDELAAPCVAKLESLVDTDYIAPASPGSRELLAGVAAWRDGRPTDAAPLVRQLSSRHGAWDVHLFALVVSPILDEAGERDLAERLDGMAMRSGDRHFRGVSAATVRSALRAAERGDPARARELATRCVDALSLVDVDIEALPRLRELARPPE